MALAEDVFEVLRQSITDHLAAYALRSQQLPSAVERLQDAYANRKIAHQLDPAMTVEAWRLEQERFYKGIDAALMAFYLGKLGP